MRGARRLVWWLLLILCLAAGMFALYRLGGQWLTYRAAEREYSGLSQAVRREAEPEGDREGEQSAEAPYVGPIDFDALWEINPDVVAWITVDGTDIDYPVLLGEDNDYYLHNTVYGTANGSGAIFMDYRNAADFGDANTILYGHQMRDGSMFAGLTAYKDQAFYEENPYFTIYTPEGEHRCLIVSAHVTGAVGEAYQLGFAGADEFRDYLDYLQGVSLIRPQAWPDEVERVITLSTCDYTYDDARMVVHGVPIT